MAKSKLASVYIVCKDREEALRIAQNLVESRLVACFNMIEKVTSIYRWKGDLEKAEEVILIGKTKISHARKIEKSVRKYHSYEVPCLCFWPICDGNPKYLDWIRSNT